MTSHQGHEVREHYTLDWLRKWALIFHNVIMIKCHQPHMAVLFLLVHWVNSAVSGTLWIYNTVPRP